MSDMSSKQKAFFKGDWVIKFPLFKNTKGPKHLQMKTMSLIMPFISLIILKKPVNKLVL